uniref:Uncharacterized protein n=1 Tax=Anser brachyrhynchus TaxID=132585 RepID=A0A8B9BKL4_9AVES
SAQIPSAAWTLPSSTVCSVLCFLAFHGLDAKSTSIHVVVREDGMKVILVQDNGCGIRLSINSSVLMLMSIYKHLSSVSTYGLRGEVSSSARF